MFNVLLYKFSKKNNSTKIPIQTGDIFECNIKNTSSILNPSIELKIENPIEYNYCYIQEFGRYYFISNWTWNQGLWIASCNVDVLATYKTQIGNTTKNVLRSASNRNQNLIDNLSPVIAENTVNDSALIRLSTMDDGYFVVGIVGSNASGQTMYQMNVNSFQSLLSSLLSTADGYDWGDFTRGMINSVMNPFQYISSCRWYPNAFPVGSAQTLKCGLWESNVQAYPILASNFGIGTPYWQHTFTIPKHPQTTTHGEYMNLSPFTKVKFDLGAFGSVDVDTTLLYDMDKVFIEVYVDAFSGIGTIYGWSQKANSDLKNRELFKRQIQYGVNIPLSSNDSNSIPSIIATTLGVVGNAVVGNVGGAISSGVVGIGNVVESMQGSIDTMSSGGSILDHMQTLHFMWTFRNQADIDYANKGYPLNQNVLISTLSGYLICDDGNIDIDCYDSEKNEIKRYLTNGFYYE